MSGKNVYFGLLFTALSTLTIFAEDPVTVEAQVILQVGDKTEESTLIINEATHTQLSMKGEALGFALRLSDNKKDDERFQTTPTHNGKPIMHGLQTGKKASFGAGLCLNGYQFEKQLTVTFLSIKRLP